MKNKNYYIGLDIGTDSVGYAVTDKEYNLCKFKGESMWGVTLFDEAQHAVERRGFRTARRRLDRRQQRIHLLSELFAPAIYQIDTGFFKRIQESYLYTKEGEEPVRLFDTYENQKQYVNKYPTIHHLIFDLMNSTDIHDVRLVYIACAWLVAHRGHFLSEVDKHSVDKVTDFNSVYNELVRYIIRDGRSLPWNSDVDISVIADALKAKTGITKKSKLLTEALFGNNKAPKSINDEYEYNYDLVIKLLCGGKVSLKDLYGKDEYGDLEEKNVALGMEDEKLVSIMQSIDDDAELLVVLKSVYDWSVLVDILRGKDTISEAKVNDYIQHKKDLKLLKYIIKNYVPEKYNDLFRSATVSNNYVAYSHNVKNCKDGTSIKNTDQENFCKFVQSVIKNIKPSEHDENKFNEMVERLSNCSFMPKQVNSNNRVIPYQLYWHELNKILVNAGEYLPFLNEKDDDGLTVSDKILSIFEFRVPYYVGPLKENPENDKKRNHWMKRKAQGRIYPWNFEDVVDLDASEEAFISRMTNTCTYLPGEAVLPKNSLCYSAYNVLNEINNIKINGNGITVQVKQSIFNDVFMTTGKVTVKRIRDYLISNNHMDKNDNLTCIDITVKSSLKPFLQFGRLLRSGILSVTDVERIISRATYSEDKGRYKKWIRANFPNLSESDAKYVSELRFKDFGRFSKKFLCGVEGINKETGETYSIIRALWETNCNIMQLQSDKFTFIDEIDYISKEYYNANPKTISERLDDMYVSNALKRPIIRTLDILKDVVKVQGHEPEMIFVEMARGSKEDEKGKRTKSRLDQLRELYEKIDTEEVRLLDKQLDELGDKAHNMLQSDKLFLYFIQLGRCLYTNEPISLQSVISGDGTYNIEHIYPRSFVKDDSILNNKILVNSKVNGEKSDNYPVDPEIQNRMRDYWTYLNKIKLVTDEKYKRLTRTTRFTEDEKYEFINRQLVETRQSTKVIAALLKEMYPDTEVVYVKAGLVSEFRQEFGILKSRSVNDLHHAKDAYLNIVVGSVWHYKFSRKYYLENKDNNIKPEIVFTRPVYYRDQTVWKGSADKDRVVTICKKNSVHMTKYAFCRKGGFFDQMPVSSGNGLVPIKKDRPTEIYGGYNKSTASFFVMVRYTVAKKSDIIIMPVELLYAEKFLKDDEFALEYAKQTIEGVVNKTVNSVEFLFNKRVIKVNTVLSLDGLRVCISGKSSGGSRLIISNITAFKTSFEYELYTKKLESFDNKKKKNDRIVWSEEHDGINPTVNLQLYDYYIEKLSKKPFIYRPANPRDTLLKGRDKFIALGIDSQVKILLEIQGLFVRAIKADLTNIGGAPSSGVSMLSSSLSNWKKTYTDVRIVDTSASGIYESISGNLIDMI